MNKIGRNDPCSCGSGRKYKKCCLGKEAADQAERRRLHHEARAQRERERTPAAAHYRDKRATGWTPTGPHTPVWVLDDDPLDDISNSVLGLIRDENFEEALRVCETLLADYPDVIDGLERSGRVYEAMGEHERAADYYQRCLDFIAQPEQRDGFDQEALDHYAAKHAEMRALATRR